MGTQAVINVDLADVYSSPDRKNYSHTLAWGDAVEVLETKGTYLKIHTLIYKKHPDGSLTSKWGEAFIAPPKTARKPTDQNYPLQMS
jgi:hypothetical protein